MRRARYSRDPAKPRLWRRVSRRRSRPEGLAASFAGSTQNVEQPAHAVVLGGLLFPLH